jgi:hypothetical protein
MRVSVHAHDDRAARRADARIESGRRHACGVFKQPHPRIPRRGGGYDLPRPIPRAAVDHEHLDAIGRVVAVQERAERGREVFGLVPHREDDRNEGGLGLRVHHPARIPALTAA